MRSWLVGLGFVVATVAAAGEVSEALRLSEDPDEAAHALAAAVSAVDAAPDDPAAFAALVEVVHRVGGPPLATDGWVTEVSLGGDRVWVRTDDGRTASFDVHTGAPTRGARPTSRAERPVGKVVPLAGNCEARGAARVRLAPATPSSQASAWVPAPAAAIMTLPGLS